MITAPRTIAAPHLTPGGEVTQSRLSAALLSVMATLILSGVVSGAFPLRYETNDDVGMNLIAAGVLCLSEPDAHLIFTNILIGYPLSRLYRFAPDIPWYGLYHLFAVISSAITINALLLSLNRSKKQWIMVCLHFASAIAPCLFSIQFTKTAFLATEAGLLALLAPWLLEESRARSWILAGIPLMLLGAAIRFEAFLLALIATAPIIAWAAWQRSFRSWKAVVAPLVTVLVCCVLMQWAHQAYYAASPGWREFYEFNGYRHQIVTRNASLQYVETTKPIFDAVGWSPADYLMLKNWFCSDAEIYSTAKLRRFAEGIAQLESSHDSLQEVLARVQPSITTMCLWACIAAFVLTLQGWPARLVVAGAFSFSMLLAVIISAATQYLPDRVLFCLFLPPAVMAVLAARSEFASLRVGSEGLRQWAGVIAALATVAFAANINSEQAKARLRAEECAQAALRTINLPPDTIFVDWGGAFQSQLFVRPLGSLGALRPVRCIGVGWGLRSPISDRRLRELGIEDLTHALLTRDDVVLVCFRGILEILDQYLFEHEGAEVIEAGFISQTDERFFGSVVKLRRVEQRPSP